MKINLDHFSLSQFHKFIGLLNEATSETGVVVTSYAEVGVAFDGGGDTFAAIKWNGEEYLIEVASP